MTSLVAIQDSAEAIIQGWGLLPIAFDNANFDSQAQDSWCRIVVADGESVKESIGCDRIKRTGLIIISIFTKINSGARPARQYADQIAALYNNVVDGDVVYRTPSLVRVGSRDGLYQVNLTIPFEITEA